MRFSDIPGYSETKQKLVNMFSHNRIGHALAFTGDEGSANLVLSIAFAQFMCCTDRSENDSCGICPSCLKFQKHQHPDVHFYFPTTTSSRVPKNALSHKYYEQWRPYLEENMFVSHGSWLKAMDPNKKEAFISSGESLQIIKDLSLKSYEAEFRFAIIWLPEKMNISSSNKLLKIIEEPPKNVYFFLITEKPELILPTIMSRTQSLRIGKMSNEKMSKWLKSKEPNLSDDKLNTILHGADGIPLKAIKLLGDGHNASVHTERFISWARLSYKAYEKMPDLINFSESLSTLSREEQKSLLNYGINFFRSGLLINNNSDHLFFSQEEERKHLNNFAPLLNISNSSLLLEQFSLALGHLERYANNKILFLDLSIHLARNINAKNVNL